MTETSIDVYKPTKTNGHWTSLPNVEDIRSQLRTENGFKATIDQYTYSVKVNPDNSAVVFKNEKTRTNSQGNNGIQQGLTKPYQNAYKRIVEINLLYLDKIPSFLQENRNWQVIESNPIVVVKYEVFAVLIKKEDNSGGIQ